MGCLLYTSYSREVGDALWREKAKIGCPYRKPTQVDEERILRPTGERLLRDVYKRQGCQRLAHERQRHWLVESVQELVDL